MKSLINLVLTLSLVFSVSLANAQEAKKPGKTESSTSTRPAKNSSRSFFHSALQTTRQTLDFFYFLDELKTLGENTGAGGFGKQ